MQFMQDRDDPRPSINTSNENISDDVSTKLSPIYIL